MIEPFNTERHQRLHICCVSALVAWMCAGGLGCREQAASTDRTLLVLRIQPLWRDPAPFHAWIDAFKRKHPNVDVAVEPIPNASDVAHQYFLTALEGKATDFDVFVADVVWIQEFARAGWIADLSAAFPPEVLRRDFIPGPVDAVLFEGRTFAVPWYADVGVLYYRSDLVPEPPKTYAALEATITKLRAENPGLQGHLWQGKQYEGLVCGVLEVLWGYGADIQPDGKIVFDSPKAQRALERMRGWIAKGISPPSVTSAAEEDSRRAFQSGNAVSMRNWPYAWQEMNRAGSPVQGKIGIASLPTETGSPGSGTLGGWQLAINANAPPAHRSLSEKLIAHLTSEEANVLFAVHYGRNPPRRNSYQHPQIVKEAPFIAGLLTQVENARPRPVSAYYNLFADVLQSEFSAAVTGLRTPEVALHRAQKQIDRLTQQVQ